MKLNIHRTLAATSLVLIAALAAGCAAPARSYDRNYDRGGDRAYRPVPSTQASGYAQYGAVASIEPLGGARQTTGGGAVIGGVVGALIGHQISSGGEKAAATAIGVVGGALLGNEIEKNQSRGGSAEAWRVVVRFNNGEQRAFDYARLNELRVGDRVRVVNNEVYRD
jgi:outer membrane lipoprotein SlyB